MIFCLEGFSQVLPPSINSYADSVGAIYADLYISYMANDTGIVMAQIQLQHGTGNNVYDSTYILPANANYAQLHLAPLTSCSTYDLLINLSSAHAQGDVINPLLTFTTLCTAGVASLNENDYAVIAYNHLVEVKAGAVPQNGMVDIYDITGRLIISTPLNQSVQQIPFNQNAGIYLLRITGNGESLYTNRFVMN